MSPLTFLLADRNSATNVWLRENPLVITAIAVTLGLVLVYFGITGLKSGATKGKYGNQLTGGTATAVSMVRLIGGVGAIGVGIYIAIFGAW
ncbi:hypothetical protein N9Y42_03250 [Mariniblastus sp.]|nr:hypothetical protein [Mariniblastus sp.]